MTPSSTKNRTGLYAGSFNPFTAGHADIVDRALGVFDNVVIALGVNAHKPTADVEALVQPIRRLYAGNPRVKVISYTGLTADLANSLEATLVRGVRNVRDFEYERDMADINRRLNGTDTVIFFAEPSLAAVSSSIVRELRSYGADITPFLPQE